MTLNLLAKEKKVIHQVVHNMVVQVDLKETLYDLKRRGIVVETPVKGKKWPKLSVTQEAYDAVYAQPPAVDPKRVNVNTGTLIDKDE